jgi:hypothetical protein
MVAHIKRALDYTKSKISGPGGAAELLGLHHNTLRHRMSKLGIPFNYKHVTSVSPMVGVYACDTFRRSSTQRHCAFQYQN